MAAHRSGGRPAIESFTIICSASGLMSLMLWRELFNRLERPEDRRRGRHCAESLAIANREYLKRRQKTASLGGGCFRRPFHRSPTHGIAALNSFYALAQSSLRAGCFPPHRRSCVMLWGIESRSLHARTRHGQTEALHLSYWFKGTYACGKS